MSRLWRGLRGRAAACSARATASCRRSSTRWKIRRLTRLQSRERRLLTRLEQNRKHQLAVIRHPLYQAHLTESLARLKSNQELTQEPFDLHRLL